MRVGNLTIKIDDSKSKKISPPNKELPGDLDAGYKEKYWEKYGDEIEVEREVEDLGIVKVENGEVEIPDDLAREMGLEKPVTEETSFEKVTGLKIAGISLTDDQISAGKKKPVSKSFRWLIEWFIMELLKAKFIVRWVKGKFSRSTVLS